ncbi:MAG: T9SS type A sorting domain-containing protein [Bacteroidales bacterium]|nr:T9SS type A sorting domain-containing protein [Bacteroidales bacterium]
MKCILSLIFLLGFAVMGIHAQETTSASGGDASGNGGSVSYSVGQVAYSTNTGINGSIAQGVQHAYEIFVTTGIEEKGVSLSVSVYPNPTSNYLQLKVESEKLKDLSYQLFDMQGKLLQNKKFVGTETQIDMCNYVPSSYFVRIINQNQLIKEFKIIKQ